MTTKTNTAKLISIFSSFLLFFLLLLALSTTGIAKKAWAECAGGGQVCGGSVGCCSGVGLDCDTDQVPPRCVLSGGAGGGGSQVETAVANPLSRFGSLSEIFGFAVNLLIGVGWSLTLVMLALGFIKYVTSRGDKIATESAQKTITMAVVGGVGLLMVMAIRAIISNILGGTVNNVGDDIGGNLVP